jgi:predicted kinase
LEHELPAVRFTHDEWMTRLYGDDPDVERAVVEFLEFAEALGFDPRSAIRRIFAVKAKR